MLDIAIDGVSMRQGGGESVAEIHLRRVTSVPFPVTVRLKLNDGSTQDVKLPVEIWTRTDRYTACFPSAGLWSVRVSGPMRTCRTGIHRMTSGAIRRLRIDRHASTSGGIVPPIPASPSQAVVASCCRESSRWQPVRTTVRLHGSIDLFIRFGVRQCRDLAFGLRDGGCPSCSS